MESTMIEVTPDIRIAEDELSFSFVRASGPGGQNVNKVSTAVQLRFDAANSPNLPEAVRARALRLAGRRATTEGVIVLDARRHRTQERNRQDAIERLVALLQRAAELPKPRTSTKPTRASRIKRLDDKRRRSAVKRARIQRDEE
jgi:ribosome-associated protein